MVKINFEVKKKSLFLWATAFLMLAGFVGVYAWANTAGVGHSYNELEPCSAGQILKTVEGVWTCADMVSVGGSQWTLSGDNIYYNSGKVGIGTTNPLSTLSVGSDGAIEAGVYGSGNTYGVYGSSNAVGVRGSGSTYGVYGSGSNIGVYGSGDTYDFYAPHSGSKNYFAGNVGIGTLNPTAKLEVTGDVKVTGNLEVGGTIIYAWLGWEENGDSTYINPDTCAGSDEINAYTSDPGKICLDVQRVTKEVLGVCTSPDGGDDGSCGVGWYEYDTVEGNCCYDGQYGCEAYVTNARCKQYQKRISVASANGEAFFSVNADGTISGSGFKTYKTYVGKTTARYDGNLGGPVGARDKCRIDYPDSYMCTSSDLSYYMQDNGILHNIFGWVYTTSNNCDGWTTNNYDHSGTAWEYWELKNHNCDSSYADYKISILCCR